jgi:large subunit ribosomal protein L27e
VTKRSSRKTQARRSSLKTFVKVANYNHMMPTRYNLDLDLKSVVTPDVVDNSTKKVEARKVRDVLGVLHAAGW